MEKDSLVVAPFVGEMGWELMRWQGYVRWLAQNYFEVSLFCRKGFEYFYEDSATEIMALNIRAGSPSCWDDSTAHFSPQETALIRDKKSQNGVDFVEPCQEKCCGNMEQEFIEFGKQLDELRYDIVFHARNDPRVSERNWPKKNWEALAERFAHQRTASIGTEKGALRVKGSDDCRGIDCRKLCDILASSFVCIGPSSGPMHLASLCRCPHIVWTDKIKWRLGDRAGTNRERYQHVWNPFKTEVEVIDRWDWQPPIDPVVRAIESKII